MSIVLPGAMPAVTASVISESLSGPMSVSMVLTMAQMSTKIISAVYFLQ